MTSLACTIVSPVSSVFDANTHLLTENGTKRRSSSIRLDDTIIRMEDMKRRFRLKLVDMDMKDRERLQKMYRHIHRHAHCNQVHKAQGNTFCLPPEFSKMEEGERKVKFSLFWTIKREGGRIIIIYKTRSQSVFTQCSITPDEETEFVNNDMPSYSGVLVPP